jgi:hypothetical protein
VIEQEVAEEDCEPVGESGAEIAKEAEIHLG